MKTFNLKHNSITYPDLDEAERDGKESGARCLALGQKYQAGGPWVPNCNHSDEPAWIELCRYADDVRNAWLRGWADGQNEG